MKQIWKRNVVAASVLLFVCVAVYLNWKYASNISDLGQQETGKVLGESTLVNGDAQEENGPDGQEVSADAQEEDSTDYFASARLNRQQARDSAISLLREAAESESADAAVANEAAETIQVLAGYAIAENQIENLVTAKGYAECVAFMGEDSISVVVSTGTEEALQAEDVARIKDIVLTETDYSADQIKILEAD